MTHAELLAVCDLVETQGLSVAVLAAPRLLNGKRVAPPKRVDNGLSVTCVGGKVVDWIVSFSIADARAYVARRNNLLRVIPLREIMPAEKMSRELRRMVGVDDPPVNPWAFLGDGQ